MGFQVGLLVETSLADGTSEKNMLILKHLKAITFKKSILYWRCMRIMQMSQSLNSCQLCKDRYIMYYISFIIEIGTIG